MLPKTEEEPLVGDVPDPFPPVPPAPTVTVMLEPVVIE
jgi:hypothetical protein